MHPRRSNTLPLLPPLRRERRSKRRRWVRVAINLTSVSMCGWTALSACEKRNQRPEPSSEARAQPTASAAGEPATTLGDSHETTQAFSDDSRDAPPTERQVPRAGITGFNGQNLE